MHKCLMPKSISAGFIFLAAGVFLLAGCGNNTSSASATTLTACAQLTRTVSSTKTVTGTLKSINGATLSITSIQGTSETATYSSTTTFTQQSTIPAQSLQSGTSVIVLVSTANNTSGTYSATSITVSPTGTTGAFPRASGTPGAGIGGFGGRGTNPCFTRGQLGTPRAGRRGAGTGTGTSNFRGLIGTVSQVSGNILTITDTTGTAYTVTITSQTRVMETKSITAKALKVGMPLTLTGTAGSQGAIAARVVSILLSLPSRPATTPTTP
jgi:hypothetical protein